MRSPANTDVPILPVIAERWSPRAFDPQKTLSEQDLKPLFEAARWSASSSNTQPWRFVYAFRGEPAFDALLACAAEGNQGWVARASVLAYAIAKLKSASGRDLWHHRHDVGMSIANLLLQATANGLAVHPFGGFDGDKVIAAASVPEGFEPCTGIAIGFPGDPDVLSERDRERELAERVRLSVADFAFHGTWPQ
jgi:nitroreductase